MRLVEIEWIDAISDDAELLPEAALHLEPIHRFQVGYVLADEDERVVISYGHWETKDSKRVDRIMSLPRCMIEKITDLVGVPSAEKNQE